MNRLTTSHLATRLLHAALPLMLAVGLSGPAAAADKISEKTAAALVQESGLGDQLPTIPAGIEAGLNVKPEAAAQLTEAQLETLRGILAESYSPAKLTASLITELPALIGPVAAKDALAWLQSDVGKKITALEDAAAKTAGDSEVFAEAQKLFERLPPRRVDRYVRLIQATHVADGSANLIINVTLGTIVGAAAAGAPGKPLPNLDEVRKQLDENRPQMIESINSQFLVLFGSAYQALPENELDQYLAFSESKSGIEYSKAMIAALDKAMTRAAVESGREIQLRMATAKPKSDA